MADAADPPPESPEASTASRPGWKVNRTPAELAAVVAIVVGAIGILFVFAAVGRALGS